MKTLDEIRDVIDKMCEEDIKNNKSIDAKRRASLYAQLLAIVEKTALEETKKTEQAYGKLHDEMFVAVHKVADPVINKFLKAKEKEHGGDSRYIAAIERLRKEFDSESD